MKVEELVALVGDKVEIVVTMSSHPKMNKKNRLTKEPCPYADVLKVGEYALKLDDEYIPTPKKDGEAQTQTAERKPWYKSTDKKWLKVSLDGTKFYISSHCLSCHSHFIADGREVEGEELKALRDGFLPTHKDENGGMKWVMISADNILQIAQRRLVVG